MRNIFISGFVIIFFFLGCATPPPAPQSVASKSVTTNATSESAAEKPLPKVRQRATGTEEDARRHVLRGMAAIEMAKSKEDLALAIDEFRMATEISPNMAVAWFNMGKAQHQSGLFLEAIESYRQYLVVAPNAQDAQRVSDEIVKLEFRQEQRAKSQSRIGTWVDQNGIPYNLTLHGNQLALKTNRRRVSEDEVRSTYTLVGNVPVTSLIQAEYQLVLQGNHLTGKWSRGPVPADKCMVPADASEVTGELLDGEGRMVLGHARTSFVATTQMSLFGSDSCGGVKAGERKTIEVSIYGPLARGGLGAALYGLNQWWDGGFSAIHFGWQGRLGVFGLNPESPAFQAGLRNNDEILAIDGVAVKDLAAGEAVVRLRGEPGSKINLEIWRKDSNESLLITFNRIEVPQYVPEELSAQWIN